jgi:hypothetical protein
MLIKYKNRRLRRLRQQKNKLTNSTPDAPEVLKIKNSTPVAPNVNKNTNLTPDALTKHANRQVHHRRGTPWRNNFTFSRHHGPVSIELKLMYLPVLFDRSVKPIRTEVYLSNKSATVIPNRRFRVGPMTIRNFQSVDPEIAVHRTISETHGVP